MSLVSERRSELTSFCRVFPPMSQQAQVYYAGKSRYLGIFQSKEQASLGYEIARAALQAAPSPEGPERKEDIERNVALAKEAAKAGVGEHCSR